MKKKWILKPKADMTLVSELTSSLGVSPIISELLVNRGITSFDSAKKFFRPQIQDLHNPFLMKDMSNAVDRIQIAVKKNEKILVYGDYDVDGTTAVSLMYSFLKSLNLNVEYYIPDRYKEGYGISLQSIDYAYEQKISLIIALDCGIKAIDQINYADEKGIEFIICDHHLPGESVPNATAVLDPKQHGCNYPYKDLSGCGVGFKLIQGYSEKTGIPFSQIQSYLDLVAVSIAADLVPITGENRILSYYGLRRLNSDPRIGLKSLMTLNQKNKEFSISDISFILAPRINAAGRIQHGKKAVALMVETDPQKSDNQAFKIQKYNINRKEIEAEITQDAIKMIQPDSKTNVVYSPDWHKGVIGIVASRIIEKFYRPTIVLTENNGKLTGSARSVKGFNVYKAINACSDLVEQFGGHKYAAGLTIKKQNLEEFKVRFEEEVSSTIEESMLTPILNIDRELIISDINPKFYRILKQMGPFGPGNSRPIFITKNLIDNGYARKIGIDQKHLKLNITDINKTKFFECIAFGMSNCLSLVSDSNSFNIVYEIEENEWNGKRNLQLLIKDLSN